MKIHSPNKSLWEVEAAHIVPHSSSGKDDIWNGIALCRLHHWALDVGWFALDDEYNIITSNRIHDVSIEYGKMGEYNFIGELSNKNLKISLPTNENNVPHQSAIRWHRENIFHK